MSKMSFRTRLLTTLNGGKPDVMPWFADLTYWYHARQMEGTLPAEYSGDAGFVQLHKDYHVGYYLGYAQVWEERLDGVTFTATTDDLTTITIWDTPVGSIMSQSRYLPQTFSGAQTRWPVQSLEDLRVLRYIAEATGGCADYERYNQQQCLAGEQGHPTVLPPRSPVSQMLAQWTGATNLSYLQIDAPDELQTTLTALGKAADPAWEAILACDTPFIEFPDNLTGEVVTGLFERYQFDYYVRRIEALHAAGKKVGTHLDGTVRPIIKLLVRTGLDYIEAITPKPTGDVAVEELRELAGPDIILFGGMPGAMFAPPFKADDIRRQVETIITHHWDYGKFIIGAADQVPPNGDINLVRLVGELCEELCT